MRGGYDRKLPRLAFESNNIYGIPDLCSDMLASEIPETLQVYRACNGKQRTGEALTFFVHDYRFECAWNFPKKTIDALHRQCWDMVCEPDFSLLADRPMAEQIWNTYRVRWCGRSFQESGLRVIPCPNWSTPESYAFSFAGIPFRPPIVAVESQTCGPDKTTWRDGFYAMIDALQPSCVLIYGKEFDIGKVDPIVRWFAPRRFRK